MRTFVTFPARSRTLAPCPASVSGPERYDASLAALVHAGMSTDVVGPAAAMLCCEWCGCQFRIIHAVSAAAPKVVLSRMIPASGPCDAAGPVYDDTGCTCHLLPDIMSAGGGSLLWRLEAFEYLPGDEPYATDPEGRIPVCRCGQPPDLVWLAGTDTPSGDLVPPQPGVEWSCCACAGVPRPDGDDPGVFAASREQAAVAIGMGLDPGTNLRRAHP